MGGSKDMKFINWKNSIIGLFLLSFCIFAHAIPVIIHNNVLINDQPATLSKVDIRLVAGNDWVHLGDILPGTHKFDVTPTNSEVPGIARLWINKEVYVMQLPRKNETDDLDINISNSFQNPAGVQQDADENSTVPLLAATVNGKNKLIVSLSKDLSGANVWSGACTTFGVVGVDFYCSIHSTPIVTFKSNYTWGVSFGLMGFSFASNSTPKQLASLGKIHYGGAGLIYTHIDFGNSTVWANGGGLILGAFGGTGSFSLGD